MWEIANVNPNLYQEDFLTHQETLCPHHETM